MTITENVERKRTKTYKDLQIQQSVKWIINGSTLLKSKHTLNFAEDKISTAVWYSQVLKLMRKYV